MACVGNDNDLREVTLGQDGAFAGMGKGAIFVDHTTASAEIARELYAEAKKARLRFHRCAGLGRPGRRREWRAHGDVRRRGGAVCAGRKGDRRLCARLQPDGHARLRPARQDGQPDLHRRSRAGPGRGVCTSPKRPASTSRSSSPRSPRAPRNPGRWRTATRPWPPANSTSALRSTGCARTWRSASPRRAATARAAGHRAGRPVLRGGAEDGRQALGYVEPDRAAGTLRHRAALSCRAYADAPAARGNARASTRYRCMELITVCAGEHRSSLPRPSCSPATPTRFSAKNISTKIFMFSADLARARDHKASSRLPPLSP